MYPGEVWSKDYRLQLLRTIDQLYGNADPDKFGKITSVYWERLKLAQLYWHKKYGALPEPHVFFDPQNPDGFRRTKGWLNEPDKYPPPARKTYRKPKNRRANGRRGEVVALRDLV